MKRGFLTVFTIFFFAVICALPVHASEEPGTGTAAQVTLSSLTAANGNHTAPLTDGSYQTAADFAQGEVLTVTAAEPFSSLYIEWARIPGSWTLTAEGQTIACGANNFLHEYVSLDRPVSSVTITMQSVTKMANIRAYGEGVPPADVQIWEPPCEKADFLVFSTHADDEILFLGGVLATYAGGQGLDVQVAYMINFTNVMPVREHEKLDGLWTIGVRNYPVNGSFFNDDYSRAMDMARSHYNYEGVCAYTTEAVRRFQPLVVVAQDFEGEYGHGAHRLFAAAAAEAVNHSAEADWMPESAALYGTYDVPKAYFHLYPENAMRMDLRQPLEAFGGKTAVEVAAEAYKKHVSQQWMSFYVSDDSNDTHKYAPKAADFGLYRSTVGYDSGNDMTEHIIPYAEQARLEAQAREEERQRAEQAAQEQAQREAEAKRMAEEEEAARLEAEQAAARTRTVWLVTGVIAAVILIAGLCAFYLLRVRGRRRRRRRKKRRSTASKKKKSRVLDAPLGKTVKWNSRPSRQKKRPGTAGGRKRKR